MHIISICWSYSIIEPPHHAGPQIQNDDDDDDDDDDVDEDGDDDDDGDRKDWLC